MNFSFKFKPRNTPPSRPALDNKFTCFPNFFIKKTEEKSGDDVLEAEESRIGEEAWNEVLRARLVAEEQAELARATRIAEEARVAEEQARVAEEQVLEEAVDEKNTTESVVIE